MKETINQRVARHRKLARLTQQEAAENLGMKCSTYSQMERKGNISAQKLLDLAAIFGVSPDVLFYGEDKYEEPQNPDFLREPPKPPIEPKPDPGPQDPIFVLTKREENIITIMRNLPKGEKEELIAYIEKNYYK